MPKNDYSIFDRIEQDSYFHNRSQHDFQESKILPIGKGVRIGNFDKSRSENFNNRKSDSLERSMTGIDDDSFFFNDETRKILNLSDKL